MKLVVKNNVGETVTLQIQPEETFVDLKKRVENEVGISLNLKDIAAHGKSIIDSQKVVEYFVPPDGSLSNRAKEDIKDVICYVPGCGNRKSTNKHKVFFDFPQEEIRCHQWVLYCQRLSMISGNLRLPLTAESAICSDHFRSDQFVKNTTTLLKRTAVPCINPELPAADSLKYGNFHKTRSNKQETQNDELFCRLCANKKKNCIFIYGTEGRRMELAEKINATLPLKIEMTDSLPKQVCGSCLKGLENSFSFAKVVASSEATLNILTPTKTTNNFVLTDGREVTLGPTEQACPLCGEGLIKKTKTPASETPPEKSTVFNQANSNKTSDSTGNSDLDSTSSPECETDKSDDDIYSCRFCGEEFLEFSFIVEHCQTHVEEGLYHCVLCEESYSSVNKLVEHLLTHKKQRLYCDNCGVTLKTNELISEHCCSTNLPLNRCKSCFKSFRSESRLQFHMQFHNGTVPGFCETCGKTFSEEAKLYKHSIQIHGNANNKCIDCEKTFSSVSSLKYHEKSHQVANCKPYMCEWCGKSFIRKSMLRNHITSTHRLAQESPCFTCKICYEAFPSTNLAVTHMDSKHAEECIDELTYSFEMHTVSKLFICEFCEKHFAESIILNKHRAAHTSDKPYSCKFCTLTFASYTEQNQHKGTHLDKDIPAEYNTDNIIPTTYLCEYCDRCFLNYIKFSEHLTIHYGQEPYHCRCCNGRFSNLDDVIQHRKSHGDQEPFEEFDFNRPYECHYCSKSFAIEDALVKHIRMHTGEKPFICDKCGKGFSQSSGLNTHKKVHSDLRPYDCPICPRTFKIKGDRDVHIRKHSGDRPYKCEFCGKAFMTQHVYSQHRKIHTGERPYKCDVCGIAFRRSHVLTVHKRIHTGEKPNVCDVCGKSYRQKGDMLKHRRAQHTKDSMIRISV